MKSSDGPWYLLSYIGNWIKLNVPGWSEGHVYRLTPKPKRKPVVQWQFIHKDVVAVAMGDSGKWFLHNQYPEIRAGYWISKGREAGLPSYLVGPGLVIDPGDLTARDWKESLMTRHVRDGGGE